MGGGTAEVKVEYKGGKHFCRRKKSVRKHSEENDMLFMCLRLYGVQ